MVLLGFILFSVILLSVGLLSSLKKQNTLKDYFLANNTTNPYLLGLSTFATNNSGFMFTAIIAYAYAVGFSAIWITVPWILGDLVASYFITNRIFNLAKENKAFTYLDIITKIKGQDYKYLRIFLSIILVVFLGVASSAQFKAINIALNTIFDIQGSYVILIAGVFVLLYSYAGGLRASIWTDFAQSIIMFLAMIILLIYAINYIGGFTKYSEALFNLPNNYAIFFPAQNITGSIIENPILAGLLIILGYFFGGAGFIAQPHLVIRYMSMRSIKDINKVRFSYYFGYAFFATVVFLLAFAVKIIYPDVANDNKEYLLFSLSSMLLPQILIGLIVAGLFASVISTVDSQVLSCSATISYDLKLAENNYKYTKFITAGVILLAATLAIFVNQSVFNLVFSAWSVMSCAFGGLIILRVYNQNITQKLSFLVSIVGLLAMYIYTKIGLGNTFYEVFVGIFISLLCYFALKNTAINKIQS
jgi:sodium/proline symporter